MGLAGECSGQRRAELRDGLRAGFFGQRERYARELK
jgi:hypothetical protein